MQKWYSNYEVMQKLHSKYKVALMDMKTRKKKFGVNAKHLKIDNVRWLSSKKMFNCRDKKTYSLRALLFSF